MFENAKFLYENYSKKIDIVPAYGVVWNKENLELFDREYGKILDFYYKHLGDINILSVEEEFVNFNNPYQKYCPFVKNIVIESESLFVRISKAMLHSVKFLPLLSNSYSHCCKPEPESSAV